MNCEIKNSISTGMLIAPGQMAGTDVGCCNEFINLDVHHNGNSG